MQAGANAVAAYDAQTADYALRVDAREALYDISDLLFGVFFEDINFAADGGLYAEMIANRSCEFTSLARDDALYVWSAVGGAALNVTSDAPALALNANNPSFLTVTNAGGGLAGAANRGFLEGMAIEAEAVYKLSFYARTLPGSDYDGDVTVRLLAGDTVAAEAAVSGVTGEWRRFEASLTSGATAGEDVRAAVLIDAGTVAFDMISLFPADTYRGEANGVRKDFGELL